MGTEGSLKSSHIKGLLRDSGSTGEGLGVWVPGEDFETPGPFPFPLGSVDEVSGFALPCTPDGYTASYSPQTEGLSDLQTQSTEM